MTQVLDVDNKYQRKTITEEYITIIAEPGSSYFSHTTPSSGCSKGVAESLVACLKERNAKAENIKAVGCDCTNVNKGQKKALSGDWKKPSRDRCSVWYVCSYDNELLMRNLFQSLDGGTTGQIGFSGSIGKRLMTCRKQPASSFQPVKLTEQLSNVNPKEFSTDQRYLLEMCNSISKDECSVDLAMRNPGCLNHSRWLTNDSQSNPPIVCQREETVQKSENVCNVYHSRIFSDVV